MTSNPDAHVITSEHCLAAPCGRRGVSFSSVRLIPIFDTSAIIDLADRKPSDALWSRLRECIPTRGCPLSFITALELFDGLSKSGAAHFDDSLKAVNLASRLSRRRVLLLPIPFIHRELFDVREPAAERSKENVRRFLGMAQRPHFKDEFMAGKIAFLEKIEELIVTTRQGYTNYFEAFLDAKFPDWRSQRQRSGHPLPENEKEKLKRADREGWKRDFASRMVGLMSAPTTIGAIDVVNDRCDAYLTHSVSVMRDALIAGYRFENNSNDFHDGMQLLYLSRPWVCLVTEDTHLIRRVNKSSQSSRILTIEQFVSAKSHS